MNTREYPEFEDRLTELLKNHGAETFFFATIVQDNNSDLSDIPILANVSGVPGKRLPAQRMAALLVDNIQKALIQLLMQYCGLTLHQAVGAVQESVKAAAFELQQQQQAFLQGAGKGVDE